MGNLVWHYTTGDRLQDIIDSGVIRLAKAGVPRSEKPCAWFSRNPEWENTVNKGCFDDDGGYHRFSKNETADHYGGLVRIAISAHDAPHDWKAFKRLSGVSSTMANDLYRAALEAGARPGDWFVSFQEIPSTMWISIEIWENEKWVVFERRSDETGG